MNFQDLDLIVKKPRFLYRNTFFFLMIISRDTKGTRLSAFLISLNTEKKDIWGGWKIVAYAYGYAKEGARNIWRTSSIRIRRTWLLKYHGKRITKRSTCANKSVWRKNKRKQAENKVYAALYERRTVNKKLENPDSQLMSHRLPGFFFVSVSRSGWSCIPKFRSANQIVECYKIIRQFDPNRELICRMFKNIRQFGHSERQDWRIQVLYSSIRASGRCYLQ